MVKRKEILFGIAGLLILACTYFGFKFLKGNNLLSTDYSYYLEYDNIQNLKSSSRVKFSGLTIGKIVYIKLNKKNRRIQIKINVSNDIEIPDDSYLMIMDGGLIEAPHLELNFGKSTTFYKNGDLIDGRYNTPMLETLKQSVNPLTQNITKTLKSSDSVLNTFLSIANQKNTLLLNNTLTHINTITAQLASLSKTMNLAFSSKEKNLISTANNLKQITANLTKMTDSLVQNHWQHTIAHLDTLSRELTNITRKLNDSTSTLGKFFNEDLLYNEIKATTQEARELMYDLKMNPERYLDFSLFGGDREPYKQPKKTQSSKPETVTSIH